jgi:hypothetical protein
MNTLDTLSASNNNNHFMDIIATKQSGQIFKLNHQQPQPRKSFHSTKWQIGGPSQWQMLLVALIENGYWTSFKQTLACPLFVAAARTLDENTEEYYGANILHLVVANDPPIDVVECILQTFPETVSRLIDVVLYASYACFLQPDSSNLATTFVSHPWLIVLGAIHFILPQALPYHLI